MFHNRWSSTLIGLAMAASVIGSSAAASMPAFASPAPQPAAEVAAQAPVAQPFWNFSAKFVCGHQPLSTAAGGALPGEPPVKPGNYATEINIHNYNYKNAPIRKKVLVLVDRGEVVGREPQQVRPKAFDTIQLGPDGATMDDCNRIWNLVYPNTPLPAVMPLMIGYLVVISPLDLDIDVVYTAEVPGVPNSQPTGISEDVERVAGKRVMIPTTAFPGGPLPAATEFQDAE